MIYLAIAVIIIGSASMIIYEIVRGK